MDTHSKHPFWRAYRYAFLYWRREWLGFLILLVGSVGILQGLFTFGILTGLRGYLYNLLSGYPALPQFFANFTNINDLLSFIFAIIMLFAFGLTFYLAHILQTALVLRRLGLLLPKPRIRILLRSLVFSLIHLVPYLILICAVAYFIEDTNFGLIAICALLPPMINVFMFLTFTLLLAEGLSIGQAIWRSAVLIRHHFWKLSLFKLLTYPLVLLIAATISLVLPLYGDAEDLLNQGVILFLASYPAYLAPALYQSLTAQTELVPENVETVFD